MIEEKLAELTKEIVALRQVMAAGNGTAAAAKTPAAAKAAAKVKPKHDKDEVNTKVREVSTKISKQAARDLIATFDAADLADLLTKPEHFDAAFDAAEAALAAAGGEQEDEI